MPIFFFSCLSMTRIFSLGMEITLGVETRRIVFFFQFFMLLYQKHILRLWFHCHITLSKRQLRLSRLHLGILIRFRCLSERENTSALIKNSRCQCFLSPTHTILFRSLPRLVLPMPRHLVKVRLCLTLFGRFVFRLSTEHSTRWQNNKISPLSWRLQSIWVHR